MSQNTFRYSHHDGEYQELLDINAELLEALEAADALCRIALPTFNWADSPLTADAIRLLNEVPGKITRAIAKAKATTP